MTKILIVGVSGMFGSSAYRLFASSKGIGVTGTPRSVRDLGELPRHNNAKIAGDIDATDTGEIYGKHIEIIPDDSVAIDRSLDGSRFNAATGYAASSWRELVIQMHAAR
jgi:dTDP-4-dehydrorhamnose reductase